nr:hypothetical protein [Paraburkholderia kururiensis]
MAEDIVERSSRNGPKTMEWQIGFTEAESVGKKRVTSRQRFLAEIEKVVSSLRELLGHRAYYSKCERSRPPGERAKVGEVDFFRARRTGAAVRW